MNEYALRLESRACSALISTAPADGDNNINQARLACAVALQAWRKAGQRERAKWFRNHISWIGYPLSEKQLAGSHFRHEAWKARHLTTNR